MRRRRVLFLSIEFAASTFSGNGVLALSQVRGLHQLGHEVLVIAGKPSADSGSKPAELPEGLAVLEVPLPVWGRLDAGCSWAEFAEGCSHSDLVAKVASFDPEVVIGVDWHSALAYRALKQSLQGKGCSHAAPYVYLNYRVYTRTAPDDSLDFITGAEAGAVEMSQACVALSKSDAAFIQGNLCPPQGPPRQPAVLLPSLRADMMDIPMAEGDAERPYLTCCVRLSPEKEPERFVDLVEELTRSGALDRHRLKPLLIAASDTAYAKELKSRLLAAVPGAAVKESFVGPRELADIAAATRLNVHPCLYDAYGMTVVECASQGVPSVINSGGSVGATDLLSASSGESFEVDMAAGGISGLADRVEEILSDPERLRRVSAAAASKARSWGVLENARALMSIAEGCISSA